MSKLLPRLRHWLVELARDERRRLMHFSISAIIFFVGYFMLRWSAENIPPSLQQELVALGILIVTLAAFCWAITLQILYIFNKIKN